ncbi:MAG: hypothetical protein NW215_08235 [Hyphomicrobiales bacterium]|nr:hypothetical protein [Hyphomicrobiales bacterium]
MRRTAAALAAVMCASPAGAARETASGPTVRLHQSFIEDLQRAPSLDIADPLAVFWRVFSSLPDAVKVYPTENYFYFSFIHQGVNYHGNLRLDASDRDEGFVSFGYFEEYALWRSGGDVTYRRLGAAENVAVVKAGDLQYDVSFRGKTVRFELNDLRGVKPPEGMLNEGETYIGPVFDESGIQFYLVFNAEAKTFLYLLNEFAPNAETFEQSKSSEPIIIGRRTSFAFYKDRKRDRKILVGVHESNAFLNNYYDGPFDQLPDNFLEGDTLKNAIAAILPEYADKIDRFGAVSGADRYAIGPYLYYAAERDLDYFDACVSDTTRPEAKYYDCFNAEGLNRPPEQNSEEAPGAQSNPPPSPAAAPKP